MRITVAVNLESGETLDRSPDEVAGLVLAAFGDVKGDVVSVTVTAQTGTAPLPGPPTL